MKNKLTKVFWLSLILVSITVSFALLFPNIFLNTTNEIREIIGTNLGWYYLLLVTLIVFLCLFLIFSPIGQIRLGDPDSKPEHSKISWLAMLFSAGMGIGLIFWGAAEPLSHYAISTPSMNAETDFALAEAFKYTFFHWGIHAWSIYGIVGLALAYFKFRKKEKSLISVTLKPLFGNKTDGIIGTTIDSITIFSTVIGVATTLGFGAIQINGGLTYLFDIPKNIYVQMIIIAITTALFIASALSGIGKGVKILSNINLILAVGLCAIAILIGPTTLILNTFVNSLGNYLQDFIQMSFSTAPFNITQHNWIEKWTLLYWAWWLSWSPFVGVFIARISKGRTIREFLINVLLIPSLFSFLWFTVFGSMSTNIQSSGIDLRTFSVEETLFATFNYYNFGAFLSIIALILIFSFFITSADSATFVLGMLSEDGTLNPKNKTKVTWGMLVSLISIVLLIAGGLDALQNVLIIIALPFSVVILLLMISLFIELNHEKKQMGLYIKPDTYPDKDEPFKSYEN